MIITKMKEPLWFEPNETHRQDMDGKTLELVGPYCGTVAAVRTRGDGIHTMAVDLVFRGHDFEDLLRIPANDVARIEDHPDQSVARFRLAVPA